MHRTTALALALVALAAARPAWAGDTPKNSAETPHKVTIRGTTEGAVRIEASDGTVLETHKLRYRMPPSAPGADPRWCSIESQPDGRVAITTEGSKADGSDHLTIRAETIVLNLKAQQYSALGRGEVTIDGAQPRPRP